MNELKEIKKTRKFILTRYCLAHLDFKMSRIQLLLEDLDEIHQKDYPKWLAEKQRSALVKDKFNGKI